MTGGSDVWRFDLNPFSQTYDPFLLAATPAFDSNGNVTNPAWMGQPDALEPNQPSDLGAEATSILPSDSSRQWSRPSNQVMVAVGEPISLAVPPVVYNSFPAATGRSSSNGLLFPVCKVASDGTVYVAYSDGGSGIFITHSFDHGRTWAVPALVSDMGPGGVAMMPWIETGERPGSLAIA